MQKFKDIKFYNAAWIIVMIISFPLILIPMGVSVYRYILQPILVAVGVLLLVTPIFKRQPVLYLKSQLFLLLFLISYAVAILLNLSGGMRTIALNVFELAACGILFLVVLNGAFRKKREDLYEDLLLYSRIIAVILFIGALISLIMFFTLFSHRLTVDFGAFDLDIIRFRFVGLGVGRLFGVYSDPNWGSFLGVCAIIFSILPFFLRPLGKFEKTFYIVNIIVQYMYIILSDSRSGLLTLSAFAFVFSVFLLYRYVKISKHSLAWCVSIAIAVLPAVFVFMINPVMQNALMNFNRLIPRPTAYESYTNLLEVSTATVGRDFTEVHDITTGRLDIWRDALSLARINPVIGITRGNIPIEAAAINPGGFVARGIALHNAFLDLIVSSGIIGTLLMCAFFIRPIKKTVIYVFSKGHNDMVVAMLLSFTVAAVTFSMLGSGIFINLNFTTVLFWLLLGYMLRFTMCDEDFVEFTALDFLQQLRKKIITKKQD